MAGSGTSPHLAGELLKWVAKIDIQAVAYKGGAPSLNDLVAGQIPMTINNIPESIGQIRAGTVRPLGITTVSRSPVLPDVPAIAETLPGYDTAVWWGLIAPAGVPAEIVAKLNHDVVGVLGRTALKERLDQLGAVPVGSTPEALDALIRGDLEKWAPIVKATNMRVE